MTESKNCLVTDESSKGVLVLSVATSELKTPETSYALRDELIDRVTRADASSVVLDLSQVEFIGSVGFLAFLGLSRAMNKLSDAQIVLCNLSATIREAFAICRLISDESRQTAPFQVATSKAAAVALLST